ncbi:hypothetical protein D9M73_132830 [compost metagenome]
MLADRGVALMVEARIDQRELPGGRGLFGEDAIAPAMEVDVFHHVARLIDAGQSRAQAKVHMAEKGVLRDAEAHRRCGRITRTDLDVDIAHRRIEGRRIGVANVVATLATGRHHGRHGHGNLADGILVAAGEHHHRCDTALKARCGIGQHQHRAGRPHAQNPHAGRHQDAVRQAIAAGGQEDDAIAVGDARRVDRALDRCGRIDTSVLRAANRYRAGLIWGRCKHRPGRGRARRDRGQQRHRSRRQHGCSSLHGALPLPQPTPARLADAVHKRPSCACHPRRWS